MPIMCVENSYVHAVFELTKVLCYSIYSYGVPNTNFKQSVRTDSDLLVGLITYSSCISVTSISIMKLF
jgi:hypothetical protein